MDEQLILTAQTLRLNPHLQRAELPGGICVLKNVPARRYLTVSLDQWNLLRHFDNSATVPEVLRAVIQNRTCLPLREYYELILKAQRAGVLRHERQSEPEERARRWAVPLSAWVPIVLGWASLVAAVTLLITQPPALPSAWPGDAPGALIGWALVCLGLSIGSALAASTLVWGGGEVYNPRFNWLRPAPYFAVNLDDASMTNRLTQVGVWSARFMPVMLTAALLWWYRPAWGWPHLLAVVVMLRPLAGGAIIPILSTLFRGQVLDTHRDLGFTPNRRWHVRWRFGFERVSAPYVIARLLWGAAWCVLVVFLALHYTQRSVQEVLGSGDYWRQVGLCFSAAAAGTTLVFVGRPMSRNLFVRLRARHREIVRGLHRWGTKIEDATTPEALARLMAESLVFRRFTPAERAELLKLVKPRTIAAWSLIRKFSDKSEDVGIIVSGSVAVYRRMKSGRADRVLKMGEGDVFGAHALLDAGRPEAQIRALSPVIALMLPLAEFQKRVVDKLGTQLANDLVHKVPFLRRVAFCATWHPQAVARFAQISATISYNDGETIVAERRDSHQFYVIYEGQVQVKRRGKLLVRLGPGGFFGEIGLLQNSTAVADAIARENVRCLAFSKADFLRFMTHNPLVGLQLEEISSRRLGRPIFPLSQALV
jgi:CRP-like cAMP-binding protein